MQGRRVVNYFGKIVERCTANDIGRITYIKLKFDRLAKLQLTKGITFIGTMANNKIFNLKEKDWFTPFQRAILLATTVEKQNPRFFLRNRFRYLSFKKLL